MDDVEFEKSEEQRKQEEEVLGERKTTRKHKPRQPSEQARIGHTTANKEGGLTEKATIRSRCRSSI